MARLVIDTKPRLVLQGERAFGPGKADLLDQIKATGSISAAARALNMSYSRAWGLVDEMNRLFKGPLVESATGGKRGGGARVTDLGFEVLDLYRRMQKKVEAETSAFTKPFTAYLR
jgi:molybdate transport system regulatory protein